MQSMSSARSFLQLGIGGIVDIIGIVGIAGVVLSLLSSLLLLSRTNTIEISVAPE